jgi:hypothetical protein
MNNLSTATSIIIAVIPIVGIVAGAAVVFFYLLWRYKIKVLSLQHNMQPQNDFDLHCFSLLAGLLLGVVGLALTIFLGIIGGRGLGLLGGLIPLACGVALLLYYFIGSLERRGQ